MTPAPERIATALAMRYRFERELGRGGIATVWLAEDVRHRRRVAIKVLHPELSAVLGPERFPAVPAVVESLDPAMTMREGPCGGRPLDPG